MKALHISFVFGFLIALFAVVVNGFHFYGPYDVYRTRAARWPPARKEAVNTAGSGSPENGFPDNSEANDDYFKIISYLNEVGRRRR